jgi:hypothetical protein
MREVLFEPIPLASIRAHELGCADKLPPGFDAWFAKCVVREREARFPSAVPSYEVLKSVLGAPPTAVPVTIAQGPIATPAPMLARSAPSRPEEMQQTLLAPPPNVSTAPPPRHVASVHPPTPAPNELPAREQSRSPMVLGLLVVGLVLTLGIGGFLVWRASTHTRPHPVAEDAEANALPPDSVSSATTPSDADAEVALVPTLAKSVAPPTHPPPVPGHVEVVPVSTDTFLDIKCAAFPARVFVDGTHIGVAPKKIKVTPGKHEVMFVNSEERMKRTFTVDVVRGEIRPVFCRPRNGAAE